jgi:hypothetical protein
MRKQMEAKVAEVASDVGAFVAIAAAYSVDRAGDQIVRGAFEETIRRWRASGQQIPLHWHHGGRPEDIIGSVDPGSVTETPDGLVVAGRLDLNGSATAREVWRLG